MQSIHQLTFGAEIEFVIWFPQGSSANVAIAKLVENLQANGVNAYYAGYTHMTTSQWKIVTDSSVLATRVRRGMSCLGIELVSPVLRGDEGLEQVRNACIALNIETDGYICEVNKNTGVHVHIGFGNHNLDTAKNVLVNYMRFESQIDSIMAPSRRKNVNQYCRSTRTILTNMDSKSAYKLIMGAPSYETLLHRVFGYVNERYFKVNFAAFLRHGTLEFRQHHGTLNGEKITAWIRFCRLLCIKSAHCTPRGGIDLKWTQGRNGVVGMFTYLTTTGKDQREDQSVEGKYLSGYFDKRKREFDAKERRGVAVES